MTRRRAAAAAMLGILAFVAGATRSNAASQTVAIASFNYQPADVRIQVGDTVEWRNLDPTVHTVTASRGEFASGSMRQGQSFRATFNAAGVYPYFCEPHETMRGMVSVTGTAPATTTTTTPTATTTTLPATSASPPTATSTTVLSAPAAPGGGQTPSAPERAGAVVATAVLGEAEQPSPIPAIAAVVAATAVLAGALRRRTVWAAAAVTLATGLLHLQVRLVLDYPEPIGTLLVVEAAGAVVLTAWLVARPFTRAVQFTAIGAHLAALGALALTRSSVGLFGFREIGWDPSPQLPLAVTLGALAVALLAAARSPDP